MGGIDFKILIAIEETTYKLRSTPLLNRYPKQSMNLPRRLLRLRSTPLLNLQSRAEQLRGMSNCHQDSIQLKWLLLSSLGSFPAKISVRLSVVFLIKWDNIQMFRSSTSIGWLRSQPLRGSPCVSHQLPRPTWTPSVIYSSIDQTNKTYLAHPVWVFC